MRSWTLPGYVYEGSPAEEEQAMISLIHFDPLAGSVSYSSITVPAMHIPVLLASVDPSLFLRVVRAAKNKHLVFIFSTKNVIYHMITLLAL